MSKYRDKRKIELSAIRSWIADASSVLDLGCGRGLLLEELMRTKRIYAQSCLPFLQEPYEGV